VSAAVTILVVLITIVGWAIAAALFFYRNSR
jgi:hypothetical protein